jgi:hypothetical protein
METVIQRLIDSTEPSIKYKTLTGIYGLSESLPEVNKARESIRSCERARSLLMHRNRNGEIDCHPYKKWQGAHWVLSILAEMGYPPGDASLIPLREQVMEWLFSDHYQKSIRKINGLVRRCASYEGNAALSLMKLELADERVDQLIHQLVEWQWPDGGWNCDKKREASHSSFMESWLPLRALALYAQNQKSPPVNQAIDRAAELFLSHEIFRRKSDGSLMLEEFFWLRYPRYWHYDILGGLIALEAAGRLHDPRCIPALKQLKEMMMPSGGYCVNGKYYQLRHPEKSRFSPVAWGPVRKGKMNEYITIEVLTILLKAGIIPRPSKIDFR